MGLLFTIANFVSLKLCQNEVYFLEWTDERGTVAPQPTQASQKLGLRLLHLHVLISKPIISMI